MFFIREIEFSISVCCATFSMADLDTGPWALS